MWGQRKLPLAPCNLHQPNPTQPNPGLGCFFFSAEIFCRINTEIHWIAYFYEHHNQHELRRGVGWEGEGGEGGGGGGKVMVSELHVSFSSSLRNSPPPPHLSNMWLLWPFLISHIFYFILFYTPSSAALSDSPTSYDYGILLCQASVSSFDSLWANELE